MRAAQLAPDDARIIVAAAREAVDAGANVAAPEMHDLVSRALTRDVTIPTAIEFRALAADAAGDSRRAARLFELSNAISRRSLPTRLWLIQRSVDRGDVASALKDFGIALRTSSAAPDILFPVLAGAVTDPGLIVPIAQLLDQPGDWRVAFLSYAISQGNVALPMSRVVLQMRDRAVITDNQIDQLLIGQLISEQSFAAARQVQDAFHPSTTNATLVRDPNFANPAARYPFGWGLRETGEAGAARDLVAGRPALVYQALPGGDGQVATQLLLLKPGAYRLIARSASAPADPASPPYWTLTCGQQGGKQIALLDQPRDNGAAAIDFTVPVGCTAQWLALNLRQSDEPAGQSGAIASISVVRR